LTKAVEVGDVDAQYLLSFELRRKRKSVLHMDKVADCFHRPFATLFISCRKGKIIRLILEERGHSRRLYHQTLQRQTSHCSSVLTQAELTAPPVLRGCVRNLEDGYVEDNPLACVPVQKHIPEPPK